MISWAGRICPPGSPPRRSCASRALPGRFAMTPMCSWSSASAAATLAPGQPLSCCRLTTIWARARAIPQIYFVNNGLSTRHWNELSRLLEGKDFSIAIISKSGTTTEPAIATRALRAKLEEKYGVEGPRAASMPSPTPARAHCARWPTKRAGRPCDPRQRWPGSPC